jgi:TusA-related sulfurtransferase
LARSSKPRRRYRPERAAFQLTLTRGGGAELTDNETGDTVWASTDDPDFMEEFPDFLHQDDLADILDYLEEVGELTPRDADRCDIREEFIEAADLAGMVR